MDVLSRWVIGAVITQTLLIGSVTGLTHLQLGDSRVVFAGADDQCNDSLCSDVYEIRLSAPTARPLSDIRLNDVDYWTWSPDGRYAVAARYAGRAAIEYMALNLQTRRLITAQVDLLFGQPRAAPKWVWSPDSSQLVIGSDCKFFVPQTGQDILIFDSTDDSFRSIDTGMRCAQAPQWSPDSTQLAFMGLLEDRNALYAIQADGTTLRRLSQLPAYYHILGWSSDQNRIIGLIEGHNTQFIPFNGFYSARSDCDDCASDFRLLTDETMRYVDFAVTTDRQQIAFIQRDICRVPNCSIENDIYVLKANESDAVPLTTPAGIHRQLFWSPNSRYVLYETIASDTTLDLSVVDTRTGAIQPIANGVDRNHAATWSPDSAHIVYQHVVRGDALRLVIVNVNTGGTRIIPFHPTTLGLSALKWSLDGRLLAFQPDQPGSQHCARQMFICNEIFLLDATREMYINLTQSRYHIQDFAWLPG